MTGRCLTRSLPPACGRAGILDATRTDRATVTSTLLTQIDDALTAAAIVIGGAFAYLKFIKGRVLTAAVGYEIQAVVTTHAVTRKHMPLQSLTGLSAGAIARMVFAGIDSEPNRAGQRWGKV